MMKTYRKWWLLIAIALLPLSAYSQTTDGLLSNKFLSATTGSTINLISTGIAYHELTWHVSGTASVCTVALDTSADGITWSAGGAIAGQTCTSNGNSTVANVVANYVRMNMTALTVTAGSSVTVTWDGWVSNPAGGGGGTIGGTIAQGQSAYGASTDTIAGGANTIDCAAFAGADLGAIWNACIAAAPAGSTISLANLTSPQTLSTAVTVTKNVTTFCGGLTINQQAAIILSGAQTFLPGTSASLVGAPGNLCVIQKQANLDQVTLNDLDNTVEYVSFDGNVAGGFTGDQLVLSFSSGANVSHNYFENASANAITSSGTTSTIAFNNIFDYAGVGFYCNACNDDFLIGDVFQPFDLTDVGTAVEVINGPAAVKITGLHAESTTGPTILAGTGSNVHITVENSNFAAINGYPAISAPSGGNLIVTNNFQIVGGGSHGPTINLGGGGVQVISGNNIGTYVIGDDVIYTTGANQNTQIVNNSISLEVTGIAGKAAIHEFGENIGTIISNNQIAIIGSAGESGDNYGIYMQPANAGHMYVNLVQGNVVTGQSGTKDVAFFFDNSANITPNFVAGNDWSDGVCVDIGTCVKRIDTQANSNSYRNFSGNAATLYAAGGSTTDIVVQNKPSFNFATLPTAGNGSQVYCADCTLGSIAAAGGTGGYVFFVNGNWTGNQAVIGSDTHTAEITGNYGPITLLASTVATGSYLVTIYTEVSTGVATSTITVGIGYHDDTGAQTQTGVLFSSATTGTAQSLTFPVRFVTGTALTYSTTTANSPKYKIFARVEAQ